jgi:hypothetical protein
MKRIPILLLKWFANNIGYKIAMIKAGVRPFMTYASFPIQQFGRIGLMGAGLGLIGYGLEIVENVGLEIASNVHNQHYLETKRDKMGHNLKLD